MKVDVQALGTFNRLAHEGAEHAAASLSQLTAVETTSITLVSTDELGEEFRERPFVGVQIGFDGELRGETVLAFDRESAGCLLEAFPAGRTRKAASRRSGWARAWASRSTTGRRGSRGCFT